MTLRPGEVPGRAIAVFPFTSCRRGPQETHCPETLVLSDVPDSQCTGRLEKSRGARPTQLFEGSRPWGGIYANSMGFGVM
jgi:hypothetical protein